MKILHTVEFYPPSVGGMQEVVKQLSERLVRLGHEVTVATTRLPQRISRVINGVQIEEFAVFGKLATGMTGELERYRQFVLDSSFDVMTNFAAQQWSTDAIVTMLDRIKAKKVFVPTGFSELSNPRFASYFESMNRWLHQYDMNVFLSDDYRDISFARNCGVKNIRIIPNGASEDEFLSESGIDIRVLLDIPHNNFLILHVGSHTGLKGHAEAIRMFDRARIPDATLLIVANDFGNGCARGCRLKSAFFNSWPRRKSDGKRLMIASLPRAETVAAYKEADLFLFPSNIECSPLVLFEAAASGTPFLTTDVGNAREIAAWTGGGVLLPTRLDSKGNALADVAASVPVLEEMYSDGEHRRHLGEAGHHAWLDRFTWGGIAREYEQLYLDLAGGSRQ